MSFDKTFLLLATALTISFSDVLPASAQSWRYDAGYFSDTSEHWAAICLEGAGTEGLIRGYSDGSFRPNATMSRAEFTALVVKIFPGSTVRAAPNFSDVATDYWGGVAIVSAYKTGLLSGYPGNLFKPNQPITRAQAIVVIAKAQVLAENEIATNNSETTLRSYFDDAAEISSYAKEAIALAASQGVVVSYPQANRLRPNDNITRGETTALLCRRNFERTDARYYVPAQYVAGWDEQSVPIGPTADNEIQKFGNTSIAGLLHTTATLDDQLFFFIEGSGPGSQMWTSDGTRAGTTQVKVLQESLDTGVQHPKVLAVSDNRFWMTVQRYHQNDLVGPEDGLWVSDGTPDGTQPVHTLNPELAQAFKTAYSIEAGSSDSLFKGQLPFAIITPDETQIWLTDGTTSAGTRRLLTLSNSYGAPSNLFMPTDDYLFFQTPIGEGNMRLWRSDGTLAGTQPLKNVDAAGENRLQPGLLKMLGDRLLTLTNAADDLSLWESSNTLELTRQVKQLSSQPTSQFNLDFFNEINPPISQIYRTQLLFNPLVRRTVRGGGSSEQMRYELWATNGTEAGTQRLATTRVSDEGFTAFDGRLFFNGNGPNGRELWATGGTQSDGTIGGAVQVLDLTPAEGISPEPCPSPPERGANAQVCYPNERIKSTDVRSLTAHSGFLYFIAADGDIYRTDGTVQGTQHVYRFDGWPYRTFPANIVKAGNKLLVMAYEDGSLKLWALPE